MVLERGSHSMCLRNKTGWLDVLLVCLRYSQISSKSSLSVVKVVCTILGDVACEVVNHSVAHRIVSLFVEPRVVERDL